MAKDQEKKRKLERESLGHEASTKRVRKIEDAQAPNRSSGVESKISMSSPNNQRSHVKEQSETQRKPEATSKEAAKAGNRSGESSSQAPSGKNKNTAQTMPISPKGKRDAKKKRRSGSTNENGLKATLNASSEKAAVLAAPEPRTDRVRTNGSQELREDDTKISRLRDSSKQYSWGVSTRSGGAYVDQDPIFVRDEHGESCIISANQYEILLMSLETSQIIRSYTIPDGRQVSCFCLCAPDQSLLQIAYDNGEIARWNWKTSDISPTDLKTEGQVICMLDISASNKKSETYRIVRRNGKSLILLNNESLYKAKTTLTALQVFRNASYIVALGPSAVVVGTKSEKKPTSSGLDAALSYTWAQIPAPKYAFTCLDARITEDIVTSKRGKSRPVKLAVAVGNEHGQIYLYSDVLSLFSDNAQLPAPRILHWHPELVSAIRFTESGYYLLSGGRETVLVFWQLDTGKRSYLPHLPAEIQRLVLSPDGTQYAMLLGDNSILVLNSTEQKAIANFPGLQIPAVTISEQTPVLPKITAVLHPQNAHHLLLAVPSSNPRRPRDITARPFLQTFDTRNSRHISRQALARNTVTDFNTGPDMRPIIPPDVHLLAVSQDGRWLATLDEWIPQALDLRHLVPRSTALDQMELDEVQEQQQKREEVFLKFWRWQDREQTWALNTRVESPHGSAVNTPVRSGPGQVFKLMTDPTSNGFVTVGEDGHVKVWQSKIRTRHGVPLQNGNKEELVEWVCRRDISLPTSKERHGYADSPTDSLMTIEKALTAEDATLAVSEDGSIIACALGPASTDDHPVVHFISAMTGEITASRTNLAAPGSNLVAMAFLKRYFITLSSNAVRVWDLIEDELEYNIDLPNVESDIDEPVMAVNWESGTFAVLSSSSYDPNRALRKVQIYDPNQKNCLFDTAFANTPLTILSGNKDRSYTVLFSDSTVRTISQNSSAARAVALDLASPQADFSLMDLSSEEANSAAVEADSPQEDTEMVDGLLTSTSKDIVPFDRVEDDRPVVRPEQLASAFDAYHGSSLPPVKDMFHAVVELFARKSLLESLDGDAVKEDV